MQRPKQKFILVSVVPPTHSTYEAQEDLDELKSLVDTYGGADVVDVIQRRSHPHGGTYIGSGKAEEIAQMVEAKKIDVIVINAIVNPTQLYHIQQLCWPHNPDIEVWDRVDLILHIFLNHASSSEAKLQIKLARMRHMGPRIYGLGESFSQQGGGVGTKGLGETNVELMKRHWRNEMKEVQDKLKEMEKGRLTQVQRRHDLGLPTVSIVGYTNAGKTSLFNLLTGKKKLEANILFATLDSSVGKMYDRAHSREIVISDTIGFIKNLPPDLIEAFKSTLMESIHADLLLHVIDITDPKMDEKIQVVLEILAGLKLHNKPQIFVFNKIDQSNKEVLTQTVKKYGSFSPFCISVHTGEGIKNLYLKLIDILPSSSAKARDLV